MRRLPCGHILGSGALGLRGRLLGVRSWLLPTRVRLKPHSLEPLLLSPPVHACCVARRSGTTACIACEAGLFLGDSRSVDPSACAACEDQGYKKFSEAGSAECAECYDTEIPIAGNSACFDVVIAGALALGSCVVLCCGVRYYRKHYKKAHKEASSAKMERQRSHQAHQQSRARRVKKIEELEAENLRLSGGRWRPETIPEGDTGEAVPFARVAPAGSQDERPAAVPGSRSGPPGQQPPTREASVEELQQMLADARRDAAGAQQREQDARLAHQQSRLRHDASKRRRQPQPAAGQALAAAAATPVAMVQQVDQRSERPERPERQRSVPRVTPPPRSRGSAPRGRGPPPGAQRGGGAGGASGRV